MKRMMFSFVALLVVVSGTAAESAEDQRREATEISQRNGANLAKGASGAQPRTRTSQAGPSDAELNATPINEQGDIIVTGTMLVEIARLHAGEPTINRAQIEVEFNGAGAARAEYPAYVAAVTRELTRLGWKVATTSGQSEQIALIELEQGSREAIAALSAARIGYGTSAITPTDISTDRAATLLTVTIRRRSDDKVYWEGRAVAEVSTASQTAAGNLVTALFRIFPRDSGRIFRARRRSQ